MKKRFDDQKILFITSIIQKVFLGLYIIMIILGTYVPFVTFEAVRFVFMLPVVPVCFIVNLVAVISSRNKNENKQYESGHLGYIFTSAFIMIIAWFIIWSIFVCGNGFI